MVVGVIPFPRSWLASFEQPQLPEMNYALAELPLTQTWKMIFYPLPPWVVHPAIAVTSHVVAVAFEEQVVKMLEDDCCDEADFFR